MSDDIRRVIGKLKTIESDTSPATAEDSCVM